MPVSKTSTTKYGWITKTLKNGKTKRVWGKIKSEKVRSTNTSRGSNTHGKPWSTDEAALKSESITEKGRTERFKAAQRSIDVANIANAANSMTKNIIGVNQQSTQQYSTPAVEQAVQGGLQQGSNKRDEDDDVSAFVD